MIRRREFLLAIAAMSTTYAFTASATDYPSRPIKIIVGYVPGGTNDTLARLIASELSNRFQSPVVVENRPGASAIIGTRAVATAEADGYTLLLGGTGPMAFNPALYSSLPYSATEGFSPISMIGHFPLVLIGSPEGPSTLTDLVSKAKRENATLNYGSSSAAFRLPTELLKMQAGLSMEHIGYKGSAEVLQAVVGGQVALALIDPGPVAGLIESGKVRALGVTSKNRMSDFPDIPTLEEQGVNINVELWSGLFAPAGTPRSIVDTLNSHVKSIVSMPSVLKRLELLSMTAQSSTPAELAQRVKSDIELWTGVAKQNNISLESE